MMEIKFFQKDNSTEIFLKKDSLKFFDYQYVTKVKLFKKISKQSINFFIKHINSTKRSSSKQECESFCQKIIKLIYLRKDLCESKSFNIPIFFSPFGECLTGDGRILISTFYIPDISFDCVFYTKHSVDDFNSLNNLILKIAEKKNYSLQEKTVLCSIDFEKDDNSNKSMYIRSLEFVDHYIYDQKLFDYNQAHYLSRFNLNYDLWDEVYEIIKSHDIENINDYVSLLDKITSVPI